MVDNSGSVNRFGKSYIDECSEALKRYDKNGDGSVTLDEFFSQSIFGSEKFDKKAKDIMTQYAGSEGKVSAEVYAEWLNSNEYQQVLDDYHSSKEFSEIEMGWVDNAHIQDGQTTKGEVKVDLLNRLPDGVDGSKMEALIDKYAGEDGVFTTEEYTNLKNDPEFKAFLKAHDIQLGTGNYTNNNGNGGNNIGIGSNAFNFNFNNFNMNNFFNNFLSMLMNSWNTMFR